MREVTGEEPKVKSLAKAYERLKKEVAVQKKKAERTSQSIRSKPIKRWMTIEEI